MIRKLALALLALVALTTACGGPKQPTRQYFLVEIPGECRKKVLLTAESSDSRGARFAEYLGAFRKKYPNHELANPSHTFVLKEDRKEGEDYKGYREVVFPCLPVPEAAPPS